MRGKAERQVITNLKSAVDYFNTSNHNCSSSNNNNIISVKADTFEDTKKLFPRSFSGAWKPVIDGKIQLDEFDNSNIIVMNQSSSSMPSPSASQSPPSYKPNPFIDRPSTSTHSAGSSDLKHEDESDSETRRVPEMPEKKHKSMSSRKRSGSSNDKEGKRLKRLLRNRVSAQQARERKKVYLVELEQKAKQLEMRNAELEEKTVTLQRENFMLRQIVKNTTSIATSSSGNS